MTPEAIKAFIDEHFMWEPHDLGSAYSYNIEDGTMVYSGNLYIKSVGPEGYIPFPIRGSGSITCVQTENLVSLKNFPEQLEHGHITLEDLDLSANGLAGITQTMNYGNLYVINCNLNNLEHCPRSIKGGMVATKNPLTSLNGIEKTSMGALHFTWVENMPLMKLFSVKNLKKVMFFSNTGQNVCTKAPNSKACQVNTIINQFLPEKNFMGCATRLHRAGFSQYATW